MLTSDRNIPLICQDTDMTVPVITVENYIKWYDIYVIQPGGIVFALPWDIINQITQDHPNETWTGDHVFRPLLLEKIAEKLGGVVDPVSMEVVIGRWLLEYKNENVENI